MWKIDSGPQILYEDAVHALVGAQFSWLYSTKKDLSYGPSWENFCERGEGVPGRTIGYASRYTNCVATHEDLILPLLVFWYGMITSSNDLEGPGLDDVNYFS